MIRKFNAHVRGSWFVIALLLVSCGGTDTAPTPTPEVLTGTFVDGPVAGLYFETATQSGMTNDLGEFNYLSGETIRFFLGNTILGEIEGASQLTPFDLVSGVAPSTDALELELMIDSKNDAVTPFAQLVNRLVFLQTLDEDSDLSNGIQIPELISELLQAVSIDFSKEMIRNHNFLRLLRDAVAQGLWGGVGKPIYSSGFALAHIYDSLGLEPELYRRTRREVDLNADGVIDSTATYSYNTMGTRARAEYDNDADGTIDSTTSYVYDAYGNITREEIDITGDGIADNIFVYTYNANGNAERYEGDLNADGVVDETSENVYDDLRNIVRTTYDDGTGIEVVTYTYDDKGNKLTESEDSNGDGTVDRYYTDYYNSDSLKTRSETDFDGDGALDSISDYFYDDQGQQIRWEYDTDGDGAVDQISLYTFNELGQYTQIARDTNADGMVDAISSYTYDAAGNEILFERDSNADGTVDSVKRTVYDDFNRVIRTEDDTDADGTLDRIFHYTIGVGGHVVSYAEDANADGMNDYVSTTRYELGSWVSVMQNIK